MTGQVRPTGAVATSALRPLIQLPPQLFCAMRSLQLTEFGAPLVWSEKETPVPRGGEVLLQTVASGVCHSDVHLWEGYYDLGGDRRAYVKDRGVTLPLTLGHEVVGRVAAVGSDVRGVEVGDVRLAYPWIGCGSCNECSTESFHLCATPRSLGVFADGGYADHVLVPDSRFLIDIGDIPPESACSYACAGLTAFSALRKVMPLSSEQDLVIIGAGGVGLMGLHVVRELTSARLVVVDVNEESLVAARRMVDCATVNARSGSAFKQIREIVGRGGVAAAVDFVGSSETAALGLSILTKSGVLVMVGLFGGELTIPTPSLPFRNLTVRGSYTGSLPELRKLVAIARSGKLPEIPVTCQVPEAAGEILRRLRDGGMVGRTVLKHDLVETVIPEDASGL